MIPFHRKLLHLLATREHDEINIAELCVGCMPTQSEVVTAIVGLVGAGELDAETLRPCSGQALRPCSGQALRPTERTAAEEPDQGGAQSDIVVEGEETELDDAAADVEAMVAESPGGDRHPRQPPVAVAPVDLDKAMAVEAAIPDGIGCAELAEVLKAEAARRGLTIGAASLQVFGDKARISGLGGKRGAPQRKTLSKARAWLSSNEGSPAPESTHAPAPPPAEEAVAVPAPPPPPTSALPERPRAPKPRSDMPPASPAPTFLKPAETAWCAQCDQRVSGAKAAKCTDRFCSLKQRRAA